MTTTHQLSVAPLSAKPSRVDHLALKTSDASGAELTLPWSLVRQTLVTKQLLLMQLTTRAGELCRYGPSRQTISND
jgi:hypothetical protein